MEWTLTIYNAASKYQSRGGITTSSRLLKISDFHMVSGEMLGFISFNPAYRALPIFLR